MLPIITSTIAKYRRIPDPTRRNSYIMYIYKVGWSLDRVARTRQFMFSSDQYTVGRILVGPVGTRSIGRRTFDWRDVKKGCR